MSERDDVLALLTGKVTPKVTVVAYNGVTFHVRECTADDTAEWAAIFARRAEQEAADLEAEADEGAPARGVRGDARFGAFGKALVTLCLCDADGKRLMGDVSEETLAMPPGLLQRLVAAVLDVNGYGVDGQAKETTAKKSSPTPATA